MTAQTEAELRAAVLSWFDARGRALPFRDSRDPWAILVSEAMAQQTQIARAAEKWTSFMAAFPTVQSVAAATPADVLRAWQGLGYNRRAVNLWRAARAIVAEHGGRVPDDLATLERLPGVGPYTARAVAAIAFGRRVGAVDTNVRRVLGRAFGVEGAALQDLADRIAPDDRPGRWTHAVMDVGATFCRPRNPLCAECPARPWCRYAAQPLATPVRRAHGEAAFATTSRWLRGRIVERLTATAQGEWIAIPSRIGGHGKAAVERALESLARDGLLERHPTEERLARLPVG
jgi:A/G-specific adenine glycosylase